MNEKFLGKFHRATLKIRHHTNETSVRKIPKRSPLDRGGLPSARVRAMSSFVGRRPQCLWLGKLHHHVLAGF